MTIQLCQVTACRQRGRHLPGCPGEPECAGCLPRVATEGLVCDVCVGRAAAQLETVIDTLPAARSTAYGQDRRGGGGGGGKPGSQMELNLSAKARIDAVEKALTKRARNIAETRGINFATPSTNGVLLP